MTQKILVTGGTGFIGRHLVEQLLADGHDLRVLSRQNPNGHFDGRYEHIVGDFTSPADMAAATRGATAVYHLAVTTNPGHANDQIQYDAQTNLLGSLTLLEQAAQNEVRRFIFVSSGGSVYGPTASTPVSEQHPTEPISAHGVSKLAVEKYLEIFRRKAGMEYRIARGSNPYGEGQDPDRGQGFVAYGLGRLALGEELVIWGDGSVVRDYIYVKDTVDALRLLLDDDGPHRLYNLGSGHGRSLNQIIAHLEQVTGRPARVRYEAGRPADVPYNCLDVTRIQQTLGWQPTTDLTAGLAHTWHWIRDTWLNKKRPSPLATSSHA